MRGRSPESLRLVVSAVCALMALTWAAGEAAAQISHFGKNKIQYVSLQWKVMRSPHFHLHFYPAEEALARVALAMAESSYTVLSRKYRHEVSEPIPLIIYSAHAYFEQTNIIPQFLPEGVGGFTDFMRSRVALPFSGSHGDFQRILQHELVHAFEFSTLDRAYRLHPKAGYLIPPLWFSEGLAEYWSRSWDSDADMVLADLVLNRGVPDIPDLWQLGLSYSTYKVGQSLVGFIAERYGEDKLFLVHELIWTARTFEDLLEIVCGVPIERINREWKDQLRRTYYPTVGTREAIKTSTTPITAGRLDMKPVTVPDGRGRFLYFSSDMGYSGIYSSGMDGTHVDMILKDGRSADLESLHPFSSRMDVSCDEHLAFVSRSGGRDALNLYDLLKRKRLAHRKFPGLIAMSSPSWSPEGRRIVFAGLTEDGYSDLFVWDTESDELRRLTHDRFLDQDPDWCPDGRWVVFASDRTAYGRKGKSNLFLLDLETHRVLYLTAGDWTDAAPRWNPAGDRVAFVSDRAGRQDLYVVDDEGDGHRLTKVQTQVGDPEWAPGGHGWLFTGYEGGTFRIYHHPEDADTIETIALSPPKPELHWEWNPVAPKERVEIHSYHPDFSLEVAQGGVAIGPYQSLGQGLQAALADLMGDRLLFFQLTNTARTSSEFLSRFNVGLAYVNLSGRTNWGISAFHASGDFLDELGIPYFRKESGAGVLLSFPFSKFDRLESSITAMYAERDHPGARRSRGFMVANYLAWVHDTSVWFPSGPMDGTRYRVAGGLTMNARVMETENAFLAADFRRYVRLSQRTAIAFRSEARIAAGQNPERSVLGGPLSLRGYDWRSVYGTRSMLFSSEIRFPFVKRFVMGFPLGNVEFPGVQGVAFVDAGNAWEKGERVPDLIGSVGVGLRMALGTFTVLRLDFARRTDFRSLEKGIQTQFFIGWNY